MTFTRRHFVATGAASLGALVRVLRPVNSPRELGAWARPYGERSPHETAVRVTERTASWTPLQDLYGIMTPSALHYEVHHAGVPDIDPAQHELLLDGLVERPLVFTMADLRRFPSESHVHFLECAGNSWREHVGQPGADPQRSHGLLSCSEWTGVPLRVLLAEAGVKPRASWLVAQGSDAIRHARSVPLAKALDDALVAFGQNGEALRPEQGYPLRLILPGWEGNTNVKWLGHLKVVDEPYMTASETGHYTDLMPNGKARQFTFVMEAKSVITRPAGGQILSAPGWYEITGLAWSGRGAIRRVEVSTDGKTWRDARLSSPVLPKALTRFSYMWRWDGGEITLSSRCTDDTGYVQPTRDEIVAVRGLNGADHYNGIKTWFVHHDGTVRHE